VAGILLGAVVPDVRVGRPASTMSLLQDWSASRDHRTNGPTSRRPLLPVGDELVRQIAQAPRAELWRVKPTSVPD
jgi:hypothetical protein